jgi:hypothetical protein
MFFNVALMSVSRARSPNVPHFGLLGEQPLQEPPLQYPPPSLRDTSAGGGQEIDISYAIEINSGDITLNSRISRKRSERDN